MTLYPEIQAQARKEIDTVLGDQRLPEWSDRVNMPYLRGVQEETLRCKSITSLEDIHWLILAPGAATTVTGGPMPHAVSKDDIYMGYKIPAGAGVMNCVGIFRDVEYAEMNLDDLYRFGPSTTTRKDIRILETSTPCDMRPRTLLLRGSQSQRTIPSGPTTLLVLVEEYVLGHTSQSARCSLPCLVSCGHTSSILRRTALAISNQ
jgi:hypothetical protein